MEQPSPQNDKNNESTPVSSQGNSPGEFNRLIAHLRSENEVEFLQELNYIVDHGPSQLPGLFKAIDNNHSLLTLACEKGLITAVQTMLRLGADINGRIDTTRGPLLPVESAYHSGNWKVLDLLLKSPKLDLSRSEPLLSVVIKNIGGKESQKCNYEKCFQLLLDHDKINVDQLDLYGSSALHYAAKFNNTKAMLELLKRGAYIGQKNVHDQLPMTNVNPEVLEQYFDRCIKTNHFRPGEDEFEIQFDYSSLVPVHQIVQKNKKFGDSDEQKPDDSSPNEMYAIDYIAETNELRHLIRHPLIASFLYLKWNQLATIFYINFFLCMMFGISTSLFALTYPLNSDRCEINCVLRFVSAILLLYIIGREVYQFSLSPATYFKCADNFMECTMIGLVLVFLFNISHENWHRTISATVILLIGVEMFNLAGSLPFWSFSTHYVMLKTVIRSSLNSLSLHFILLLTFSLTFYTLLRGISPFAHIRLSGEYKLNNFDDIGLSIVKTIVMSTGEFDAADIDFEVNRSSYYFFIGFLFLISTVLFNLLNGLAVNDVQAIKSEAELTNFIHRCHVLARYECSFLANSANRCSIPILMKYFSRDAISVLKKIKPFYRVGVQVNANNRITTPNQNEAIESGEYYGCFVRFGKCSRMSDSIIKSANCVLKQLNAEKYPSIEKDPLMDEIKELKASIELIKSVLLVQEAK